MSMRVESASERSQYLQTQREATLQQRERRAKNTVVSCHVRSLAAKTLIKRHKHLDLEGWEHQFYAKTCLLFKIIGNVELLFVGHPTALPVSRFSSVN